MAKRKKRSWKLVKTTKYGRRKVRIYKSSKPKVRYRLDIFNRGKVAEKRYYPRIPKTISF